MGAVTIYTLDQLIAGLEISPGPEISLDKAKPIAMGARDSIVDWLDAKGLITGPQTATGAYPIACPNEAEHSTSGATSTVYSPVWGFKCSHGHCAHLDTEALKKWIYEQDPDADVEIIPRQLVVQVGEALRRALGTTDTPSIFDNEDVRAAVEADLIHVASEDKYWSIRNKGLLKHRAIDDILTPKMKSAGLLRRGTENRPKADMPPHIWLRQNSRIRRVSKITHRLGSSLIVDDCLNIAPPIPEPVRSEAFEQHGAWAVAKWLRLVLFICGCDKFVARIFLDWAAMVVSAWDEKPGWAIMLKSSAQGTGKNLMLQPLIEAVGVEHYQAVTAVTLSQPFNEYLTKRLNVVDEIKSTTRGKSTGHDVYAMLKAHISRGAGTVTINAKNLRPFTAADLAGWAFTSNEGAPLPLEASDRRLFVIEALNEPKPIEFYVTMAEWYKAGGYAAIAAYLHDRWARITEERKRIVRTLPPMTQAKMDVIEMSDDGINGAVRDAISGKYEVRWNDLMTLKDMITSLKTTMRNEGMITEAAAVQVNNPRLIAALKSAGAIRLNNGNPCGRGEKKVRLWLLNPLKKQMYEALGFGAAMYDKWVELNPKLPRFDIKSAL